LVHVRDTLLESGLGGADLIAELFLPLLAGRIVIKLSLKLVNLLCGLLTVVGEALYLAATFHPTHHLHSPAHLLCDLCK